MSAHIADLQGQINSLEAIRGGPDAQDSAIIAKAKSQLNAARESIQSKDYWARFTGRSIDRAWANIHEAEVAILRVTPDDKLRWKGLPVLTQARLHLSPDDARLQQLEALIQAPNGTVRQISAADRELAVNTLHSAYQAEEAERARVRSFTAIVFAATVVMVVLAAGFAIWAFTDSAGISERFCFPKDADKVDSPLTVCPLGEKDNWEGVWFIEFVGMLSAAVAGAVSLRKVRGTAGPYHVAMSLLLLRLPVGALTAILGLLLMSGRFFPGLTALDTSSQIVAWAIAFGILQESVTRAVDRQGQLLLDNIKVPGRDVEGTQIQIRRAPAGLRRRDRGGTITRIRNIITGRRTRSGSRHTAEEDTQ
ncbi:hypothetical protein ACFYWX_01175 [Streptomyces sp. NPDC002888]|uniref:hypothetical protein n=1 Tax=Streptomyces sp. NPDC002888 TaxID=3364668 RepID=UPI0036ACD1FF